MATILNGSPCKEITFCLSMPIEMVDKLRRLVEAHPTSTAAVIVVSRRYHVAKSSTFMINFTILYQAVTIKKPSKSNRSELMLPFLLKIP